jgi:transcriptional regulator with XRE-family HTH domain
MGSFAREVGRALRDVRRDRGLTLRQVSVHSHGRFKPSVVAGYERAERAVTLERFCDLARFYGVPPERILADILRELSPAGRTEMVLDLDRLRLTLPDLGEGGRRVAEFVDRMCTARRDEPGAVVTLRSGDLEAIALETGRDPAELLSSLRSVLRVDTPGELR